MKILFVRAYCPNPIAYGSEMRSSRFVDYLGKFAQLDLLTLTKPTNLADQNYIKNKFQNFFYFDQVGSNSRLSSFEKLIKLLPWQLTEFYSKDIQSKISKIVQENQYDFIFIYKLSPLLYFLNLPRAWRSKVVIDFDDILSDLYFNYYKNFFTARKNSYSLRFYENKALKQFKRVFVCSNDAVLRISARHRNKAGIIPNIFSAKKEDFFNAPKDKNQLLFVGSLDYFPNTDGLKWFFSHIWPEFKKTYPNLKMTVVGKAQKSNESLKSFFGNPVNVEVALNVPDVRPYYQNCFATVVPLLNGSGTRLKILESAAYGRPVMTTAKGMEGLNFQDQNEIFVFNDSAMFINAYQKLLDDQSYRQITQAARDVLTNHYSPQAFESYMSQNWQLIQTAN